LLRLWRERGCANQHCELIAVRLAAGVLAPSHLRGVGSQIDACDTVMDVKFTSTHPEKEAFSLIGASATGAARSVAFTKRLNSRRNLVECAGRRIIGHSLLNRIWRRRFCQLLEALLNPAFIIVAFKLASSLDELVMLGFCSRLSFL